MPVCSVPSCGVSRRTTSKYVQLHRFPKDEYYTRIWVRFCRKKDYNLKTDYICSLHFADDAYVRDMKQELLGLSTRKFLRKDAVPTLHFHSVLCEVSQHRRRNFSRTGVLTDSDLSNISKDMRRDDFPLLQNILNKGTEYIGRPARTLSRRSYSVHCNDPVTGDSSTAHDHLGDEEEKPDDGKSETTVETVPECAESEPEYILPD